MVLIVIIFDFTFFFFGIDGVVFVYLFSVEKVAGGMFSADFAVFGFFVAIREIR